MKDADANAVKLTEEKFLAYVDMKRVRYKSAESQQTLKMFLDDGGGFIDQQLFYKILILGSCGGKKNRIGEANFKKLMNHMDIDPNVKQNERRDVQKGLKKRKKPE